MRRIAWVLVLLAAWAGPAAAVGTDGRQTVRIGDVDLQVFTYHPNGCVPAGLLVVLHGLGRNAAGYREYARPLADRFCLLVAAPLFDSSRFPTWRYQHGGIADKGIVQDSAAWTGGIVLQLVDTLRREQGAPDLPYFLIGHSAGGQFLSRIAAFMPNQARRMVIANPSTWVEPSVETAAPYGFGGVPAADTLLRRYLAAPVTVLLGQEDTGSEDLFETPEAVAQGPTRIARGERTFQAAAAVARAHGWAFGWRLVEVPGVGHRARSMFGSAQAAEALGLAAAR
jgi:pimeloyl-ACP methyl ester carboxylesterase